MRGALGGARLRAARGQARRVRRGRVPAAAKGIFRGPRSLDEVLRIACIGVCEVPASIERVFLVGFNENEVATLTDVANQVFASVSTTTPTQEAAADEIVREATAGDFDTLLDEIVREATPKDFDTWVDEIPALIRSIDTMEADSQASGVVAAGDFDTSVDDIVRETTPEAFVCSGI